MVRHAPTIGIIGISLLVWVLWLNHVYPFSEKFFSNSGYGMHFFGGLGYAAFQVLCTCFLLPGQKFTRTFFAVQAFVATAILCAIELLQFFDPLRHVQIEDIIAQTGGILLTLALLWRAEKKTV